MSLTAYLSFITTCAIIESTPGPNMAYLAILSAGEGRKSGFFAVLGVTLGLLVTGIIAALGVATLISNSAPAYQALRIAGVLYLLWLAWDGWQEETETSPGKTNDMQKQAQFFRRGLIVNLLNPKAAVFYVAILPGFIDTASSAIPQAVILTVTYVAIATAIHTFIVLLAGEAQKFLTNNRRRLILRRVLSLALGVIALWFAWTTRGLN